MSDVFRVNVLPAQRGDALWIEYGPEDALHHVLVDGGIMATGRDQLRRRVDAVGTPLHFELLVITHIDLDHILGVLQFLDDLPAGVTFGDIWFNGWDQLKAAGMEPLGVKEGIRLSDILQRDHRRIWNKAAGGRAIALDAEDAVVAYSLDAGMKIKVLGPTQGQLSRLRDRWADVVEEFAAAERAEDEGVEPPGSSTDGIGAEPTGTIDVPVLAATGFEEDDTVPNGSSIALALEYGGRTALMLADAYPSVVARSLRSLAPAGRFEADVVKVAHHGSRSNTDRELAAQVAAPTWIFSSNGANNTKHPHREAVARVLHYGSGVKTLVFNYRTRFNQVWDDADLMGKYGYEAIYGDGASPVTVILA
jgi:hypothetical protein